MLEYWWGVSIICRCRCRRRGGVYLTSPENAQYISWQWGKVKVIWRAYNCLVHFHWLYGVQQGPPPGHPSHVSDTLGHSLSYVLRCSVQATVGQDIPLVGRTRTACTVQGKGVCYVFTGFAVCKTNSPFPILSENKQPLSDTVFVETPFPTL